MSKAGFWGPTLGVPTCVSNVSYVVRAHADAVARGVPEGESTGGELA